MTRMSEKCCSNREKEITKKVQEREKGIPQNRGERERNNNENARKRESTYASEMDIIDN